MIVRWKSAGMAMLTCLLFLTALMLLGLSTSADTLLQIQLTANLQERERARQAALAALSWAESWLLDMVGPPPSPCTSPCEAVPIYSIDVLLAEPEKEPLSWWQAHGREAGTDPGSGERVAWLSAGSHDRPYWVAERVHEQEADTGAATPYQAWYRIRVRATGWKASSVTVVESIITRPWPSASVNTEAESPGAGDDETVSICRTSESGQDCARLAWRRLL